MAWDMYEVVTTSQTVRRYRVKAQSVRHAMNIMRGGDEMGPPDRAELVAIDEPYGEEFGVREVTKMQP